MKAHLLLIWHNSPVLKVLGKDGFTKENVDISAGLKHCTSKLDWLKVGSGAETSIRTYDENLDIHAKKG